MMTDLLNPMAIAGKRILVTGASSGIGRASAILFSQLGARVVLLARRESALQETLDAMVGDDHQIVCYDLSQPDGLLPVIKKLAQVDGPFDGFFHSAGVMNVRAIPAIRTHAIQAVMGQLPAFLLLTRAFIQRGVFSDSGGSMVVMSSVMGHRGLAGLSIYSAAKAAVEGAVRSLACELAPKRIRINAIAAGAVRTEMHNAVVTYLDTEGIAAYEQRHLLGFGDPLDIAYAAVYLLSDAGKWITGTTLIIDGGYSCH